ncbi:FxSxx-COOH system tetratricopeptide repeat protein [Micromonospora cremea]|uniref:MinD-like ATPase involved in chromosome partitioning or flagellar assembly n=1 Tax=Micromonospora cremea TaxID=709881 RepID=A0A1N5TR22_9ACTN|nr:FxSxx-COOH system tetratricopeptide repeat protein [Micromonospora cremea]SIM50853.1 MinD-like ATPase involved in chromosome partitioning or flagellar assembly [Micromonospora cremea]
MTDERNGQVVTFYSFKGGTGRTMALANVAWILAANGKKVLVADWDLESPGLHRFYHPFIDLSVLPGTGGVIDMIRGFENQASAKDADGLPKSRSLPNGWEAEFARVRHFAFSLNYTFPGGGSLDFLSAGRQNQDYAAGISGLDWDVFYDGLGGEAFIDALRADMRRNYDYTLIDSRTGLSDVASICTIHLPDVLVDCFTFSDQGIEGAARVAREVTNRYTNRRIRVLPAPMRVDPAEQDKANAGRAFAMHRFAGLPGGLSEADRRDYWAEVEVPYVAYYAYEETLATFGTDRAMLSAYERLTSAITEGEVRSLPRLDDAVRNQLRSQFERKRFLAQGEILLRYAPKDQAWAEWIERVLGLVGIQVIDAGSADTGRDVVPTRTLTVVSTAYAETTPGALPPAESPGSGTPLAVYVDDVRPLPEFVPETSVFLNGLTRASDAAASLLRLVGRVELSADKVPTASGARYPGIGPELQKTPVANVQFIGRDEDLRRLRHLLQSGVSRGYSLVALRGMGGVGKTQIALEYVHRFRTAYDLVFWIEADPQIFVDSTLVDLGERMGLPEPANIPAAIRQVHDTLVRGDRYPRWLLVFDNVADYRQIEDFLPMGGRGHIIITAREKTWEESAETIEISPFSRAESVEHLQRQVPGISPRDADRVAEALGDLPIALALGGALMADSGIAVDDYLAQLAEHGASLDTWGPSLDRLRQDSPGAYRLLEICSVLSVKVSIELLNSKGIGKLLRQADPSVPTRSGAARLIQRINRLALLRLDTRAQQIEIHRLLRDAVQRRMTEDEQQTIRREVISALAAARPDSDVDLADSWERFRMLWPHLEESEVAMRAALDSDDPAVLDLLVERVRYIWLRGVLSQARDLAERILKAWTARFESSTDPDEREMLRPPLLRLRFNFGNILRSQGHFQQAYTYDEETLAQQQELLGETHADALMTAGGLAGDLRGLGRYGEALARDEQTYRMWSRDFGNDFPRTLTALNNLAASMRLAGRAKEAQRLDDQAYERRRVVLGRNNHWTLASAVNLARDLRESGEYERSLVQSQEALTDYQSLSGPNALATLGAQTNLGVALRTVGRPVEAARLLDAACDTLQTTFGEDSPDTLAARLSRATNRLALDDAAGAEEELRAVQALYRALLGPRHPHTLICENNLAGAARAQGHLEAARMSAHVAVSGLGEMLHPEHPFVLAAQMNLAVCKAETGDLAGAFDMVDNLHKVMRTSLGIRHPDTLRAAANRALIRSLREPDSGPEELEAAVAELVERLGGSHPDVRAMGHRRLLDRVLDPHPF